MSPDGVFALPTRLTLDEAADWAQRLRRALQRDTELDCGALTDCDAAAVSLLLDASRLARARGVSLTIARVPPQLKRLIDLYAVAPLLPLAG